MNNPLVSVLIPVFNSENYLRSFLETVVLQTLENIEIIAINNQSTDCSLEILNEFKNKYPDKFFVYTSQDHYEYVGAGRNLALSYAKGEYIYFCDSDDLLDYCALEILYKNAKKYDSDIVCAYAKEVSEDLDRNYSVRNMCFKHNLNASNAAAILSAEGFWVRLIRRSLLQKIGKIPEDVTFDDIAYLPVLQSYASKIRFVSYPVYYYFLRSVSTVGTPSYRVVKGSFDAEKYALEHCKPEFKYAVQAMVATRIHGNLQIRWQYTDVFIKEIKEYWQGMEENDLIKRNPSRYKTLEHLALLPDKTIPNIVYINEFGGKQDLAFQEMVQKKAFHDGCKICILNEGNCDIACNQVIASAYKQSKYDFVGQYFAVKNIYENGGVYLDHKIKILNCFNFLKYHQGFFSYIDDKNYSEHVFGAAANNKAFKSILETYRWNWNGEPFMPLNERIKLVLVAEYDMPLNGRYVAYGDPVSLLPPSFLVVDIRFGNNKIKAICEHDFSECCGNEDYITIKRTTLKTLIAEQRDLWTSSGSAAQKELAQIKASNTWKVVQKLRKLGDSRFGPFLKKIFHGLLKIYKRIKK